MSVLFSTGGWSLISDVIQIIFVHLLYLSSTIRIIFRHLWRQHILGLKLHYTRNFLIISLS